MTAPLEARTVGQLLDLLRGMDPKTPLASNTDGLLHLLHKDEVPTLIQLPPVPTIHYNFTWKHNFIGSFVGTKACMAGFFAVQSWTHHQPNMVITAADSKKPIKYAYGPNHHPLVADEPMTYVVTVEGLAEHPVRLGATSLDFLRGLHMAATQLDLDLHLEATGPGTDDQDFWRRLSVPHIKWDRRPRATSRSPVRRQVSPPRFLPRAPRSRSRSPPRFGGFPRLTHSPPRMPRPLSPPRMPRPPSSPRLLLPCSPPRVMVLAPARSCTCAPTRARSDRRRERFNMTPQVFSCFCSTEDKLDSELGTSREMADDLHSQVINDLEEMGFSPPEDVGAFMLNYSQTITARYTEALPASYDLLFHAATIHFGPIPIGSFTREAPRLPDLYGPPLAALREFSPLPLPLPASPPHMPLPLPASPRGPPLPTLLSLQRF